MTELTMVRALNTALRDSLDSDGKVIVLGEDVGRLGGVFRVTDGLQKDFGDSRVVDTPLGESGIVGSAVGLAMRGYRPVCEIQFDGFVYPAFDQIVSQVAKLHNRSGGLIRMPITIRIPFGGGIGAIEHHSESPEAYFAHTAGLKVVSCSSPTDAYWMLRQSIASDDPVIFLEPKRRYWNKADVDLTGAAPLPLHRAAVLRAGTDVTVVGYGPSTATVLAAADVVESEGRSVEVIDLRSLSPLDTDTVVASVQRTGRLVIVHEASLSFGVGSEIAARVQEKAFHSLQAPVLRVTGFDTPYPPGRIENDWLPNLDRIVDTIETTFTF